MRKKTILTLGALITLSSFVPGLVHSQPAAPAPPPAPAAGPAPARVEAIGGARWSDTLGFVQAGPTLPPRGGAPSGAVFVPNVGTVVDQGSTTVEGFSAGDRVRCNWLGHGTEYPGAIRTIDGGRLEIDYDDGDHEFTTPDRCRKE